MTRLIIWLSLAVILLSGCALSKNAEIEIRATALRHAFKAETSKWEWEGKKWTEISQWIFIVECDAYNSEVIGSLSDYPVVSQLEKVNRDDSAFVDASSGKSVAFWRVKNVTRSSNGTYLVDVGCSKGGLNGYGQILSLKKVAGCWVVISSTPTWVS
jgi:hypothetical protein